MEINKEFLGKIKSFGILGYQFQKLVNVLDLEDEEIEQLKIEFSNPNSAVSKAYQRGADRADYMLDQKLFDLASKGDKKALEMFERRKIERGA